MSVKSRSQLDHPGDVVDGEAVDQERGHAHLLEPRRRAAEEIALGRPPVLAVDAADAVPAAPKREPEGKAELDEGRDEIEGVGLADQRERLEQDQVRRLVLEDPRQQAGRAGAAERLRLVGDGEGDRPRPVGVLGGSRAREADARCARCPSSGGGRSSPRPSHPYR